MVLSCHFDLSFPNHVYNSSSTLPAPVPAAAAAATTTNPVVYTPGNPVDILAHPVAKRRRAKRTEDERIEYLRSDPYVAKFEAYRVLCASCDKWIRLRPNSTYCSIPWDAHRKSCLAKKMCVYAPSFWRENFIHILIIPETIKMCMRLRNAINSSLKIPISVNSMLSAYSVVCVILGL